MKRGFMMILCLMLAALLMVIVLGMLGARGPQHEAAVSARLHMQAWGVAQAGLEDVRAKLAKDLKFPPLPTPDQRFFAYAETIYDVDDTPVGRFQVKLDQEFDRPPYYLLKVTSIGTVGDAEHPTAQVTLLEEVDSSPLNRADVTQPNSKRFNVLLRQELP